METIVKVIQLKHIILIENESIKTLNILDSEECPEYCTDEYHPLCGSDEVTYLNECQFKIVKCSEKPKLYVKYEGEC